MKRNKILVFFLLSFFLSRMNKSTYFDEEPVVGRAVLQKKFTSFKFITQMPK